MGDNANGGDGSGGSHNDAGDIKKNINNGNKNNSERYTINYDPEETNPLKRKPNLNQLDGVDKCRVIPPAVNIPSADNDLEANLRLTENTNDSIPLRHDNDDICKKEGGKFKGFINRIFNYFDITKRAQLPFLILFIISIILLIVLIILIILWPRIPDYLTSPICSDNECMDSSTQLLKWTNTTINPCDNPYEWSCGNFYNDYEKHTFYGMNKGEWNYKTDYEYNEIENINSFISRLPSIAASYSAQSMLKELYTSCMQLDAFDKNEGVNTLKKSIKMLYGWGRLNSDSYAAWNFREVLPLLQSKYGASPFFKVTIEPRNQSPYDGIITISEGEVGLNDKHFYNTETNKLMIQKYKILLRDTAINLGVVTDHAEIYADEIYNYEKRIVNTILVLEKNKTRKIDNILTLSDVQNAAQSLPILDTIRSLFPNTKITEKTLVRVKDIEVLRSMSRIVSTTDTEALRDFIVSSLIKRFLPFLFREHQTALEIYEKSVYGNKYSPPKWYFCTKLIKQWAPFAVEALQQNPHLIVVRIDGDKPQTSSAISERLTNNKINLNDELIEIIFGHIRNEYKEAIHSAPWINEKLSNFIIDKLTDIKLQIGIPKELLMTDKYLNKYYHDFLLKKINFLENLESQWEFERRKMEERLTNVNDTIKSVLLMYASMLPEDARKPVKFLPELNTIAVTREYLKKPYYDYNYPVSVNFARIGVDIAESILDAILLYEEDYKDVGTYKSLASAPDKLFYGNEVEGAAVKCLTKKYDEDEHSLPERTKLNLYKSVTGVSVTLKSLRSFLNYVDNNQPVIDVHVADGVTYDLLGLKTRLRQPGLRRYNDLELFILAKMQQHCSIIENEYKKAKPYYEYQLPEEEIYYTIWKDVADISNIMHCKSRSYHKYLCDDLL